jgi:dynein heavy chain 1
MKRQVRADLQDVASACAGTIKQTNHIRALLTALNKGIVFDGWSSAYKVPAGLTVNKWIVDLAARVRQFQSLSAAIAANKDIHTLNIWIGGLFVPEAFITATRQSVAQSHSWPLEQLVLRIIAYSDANKAVIDDSSFVVSGMRVEGAQCDSDTIVDSATIAYTIPAAVLKWTRGEDRDRANFVELPIYLNGTRLALITTVNFRTSGSTPPQVYYQRGVCILCSTLSGADE